MAGLVCYRAAAYPTPVRSRAHGLEERGGRFHEPGSPPTQYLALHPLGPWAERLRAGEVRDEADALELRVPTWALRLTLDEEPLLVDFEAADRGDLPHPIEPAALVADDPGPCRELARHHREDPDAPKVLRVPSAALPGTENLVIFGPARAIPYELDPRRSTQIPSGWTAVHGHCARSLLPFVRHYGEPHLGHEAWRRGRRVQLPPVELGREDLAAAV